MEKIVEVKGCSGIAFEKYRNNKMIQLVTVDSFIKEIAEITYFLLIDSYGHLIQAPYNYINIKLKNKSFKKREQAFVALKLLYTFIELFGLSGLTDINRDNLSKLDEFLEGGIREGNEFKFVGVTIRSNSTINKYYSVYRAYFTYLNIEDNIFEELRGDRYQKSSELGFLSHAYTSKTFNYDVTKVENIANQVPKFITLVEYQNILKVLVSNYSLREELIIVLMYEYGMRIGEVLGLTIEDVLGTNITKDNHGILVIRNRYTDKHYQSAKGCMKTISRNIYNRPEYHKVGLGKAFGCEYIKISLEALSKIENYIKKTRSSNFWGNVSYNNLKKKNIADKVTDRKDVKRNSYIIVSKNGTPLCSKAWDNIVKQIFKMVNLDLDFNKKEYGLSHRFRHGFAMFKVLIEKYDRLELQKVLRHTNIHSCESYFSLTVSQKSKLVHDAYTLQM